LGKTETGIKDRDEKMEEVEAYSNNFIDMVSHPLKEKVDAKVTTHVAAITKSIKKMEKLQQKRDDEKRRIHSKHELNFPVGDEETDTFADGYLTRVLGLWF